MRPIIGILAEVEDTGYSGVKNAYINSIENAGGLPLLLPFIKRDGAVESFVSLCDGFLFTGGADIDPTRYGEETIPLCGELQKMRDDLEFRVLEEVVKTKKPIMAICRGCQLVNVFFGGSLYQDIPSQLSADVVHKQTEEEFSPSHSVNVKEGTPLFDLVKKKKITANSFHHQAIKRIGKGLYVMAVADDGIIEAVYYEGDRYIRAYQWHPERLTEKDRDNRLIFEDFISACGK